VLVVGGPLVSTIAVYYKYDHAIYGLGKEGFKQLALNGEIKYMQCAIVFIILTLN
jgi:hypothetical protein